MKKQIAILYVVLTLGALVSMTYGQKYELYPVTILEWEGELYSRNVFRGKWLPNQRTNSTAFVTDDYSWGMLRTKNIITKGTEITFSSQFKLKSGGVNSDQAYFGFGDNWVAYKGQAAGICFQNNSIYLFRKNSTNGVYPELLKIIGNYSYNENITFSLVINENNTITYKINGKSQSYNPGFIIKDPKIVIGVANSTDGFIISDIKKINEEYYSDLYPFNSRLWNGISYSMNVRQGNWLPVKRDGSYSFSTDDFSWGLIQSNKSITKGTEFEFTTKINLNSGGRNSDQAYFGFSDEWAAYVGEGVGICFYNNEIYLFKLNSSRSPYPDLTIKIGSYIENEIIVFTLILNKNNTLSYRIKDINGSFDHGINMRNPKVVIGVANSIDGFNIYGLKAK